MKILFLLKKGVESGGYSASKKGGLYNSATILSEELYQLGYETKVVQVVDGNGVDKEVYDYRPDVCVIEALWVTPAKIREVAKLHHNVEFIVRIHSELSFLQNEGIAMGWIGEYIEDGDIGVAFNSEETTYEFRNLYGRDKRIGYLPNIYHSVGTNEYNNRKFTRERLAYFFSSPKKPSLRRINVGCFGAIRPLKNQLIEAVSAITYANKYNKELSFYMNTTRQEQGGQTVYKNIISLFEQFPQHSLIELPWMGRHDFLQLLGSMDVNLQCSFSESFNIIAADSTLQHVPMVVSDAIKWAPAITKIPENTVEYIVKKMEQALSFPYFFEWSQVFALNRYNEKAARVWLSSFCDY